MWWPFNLLVGYAMGAMFPTTEKLKGLDRARLRTYLRSLGDDAPFIIRLGLVVASFFFVVSPLFTVYLPLPAFFLSRRLRDKHANKLATHPIYLVRQIILLLKMFAGLCWGQDPEVRAALGVQALTADPGTWRTD